MENPIKMDDLRENPLFLETSKSTPTLQFTIFSWRGCRGGRSINFDLAVWRFFGPSWTSGKTRAVVFMASQPTWMSMEVSKWLVSWFITYLWDLYPTLNRGYNPNDSGILKRMEVRSNINQWVSYHQPTSQPSIGLGLYKVLYGLFLMASQPNPP